MKMKNSRKHLNQHRQMLYIFLYILIISIQLNIAKCQFISRQADRVQIIYDTVISLTLMKGYRDKIIDFNYPTFQNIPQITFSIISYNSNQLGYQGFKIEAKDVEKSRMTVRVTTYDVIIMQLRICIVATDFPNSLVFKQTEIKGTSSKSFTAPGKIIGYCAFFFGFMASTSSQMRIRFDFKSILEDSKTVKVSYDTSGPIGRNIISIDYNVLIIYEQDAFDSTLYSFIYFPGLNYSYNSTNVRSITFETDLQDRDRVVFGLRYIHLQSGKGGWPSITAQNNKDDYPISNKKIIFNILSGSQSEQDGEIVVFQMIMKFCPEDKYIIKDSDGQYVCTSDCTSVNPKASNIPSKIFKHQYSKYSMKECSFCSPTCYECTGPSEIECSSCKSGLYYDSLLSKCLNNKPEKQYCKSKQIFSETYQHCSPCYKSCQTCAGPQKNQCTSCAQYHYRNIKKK